jgi:hypothetical protein
MALKEGNINLAQKAHIELVVELILQLRECDLIFVQLRINSRKTQFIKTLAVLSKTTFFLDQCLWYICVESGILNGVISRNFN